MNDASAAEVHLVSLWLWPLTSDLENFSAVSTHMMSFVPNVSREVVLTDGQLTAGWWLSLSHKSAFVLAMILTFNLWLWKPFKQFPLTWRLFVSSFIQIRPLSTEISLHTKKDNTDNGRPDGRTDNGRTDRPTDRQTAHIMLSAYHCWRRHTAIRCQLSVTWFIRFCRYCNAVAGALRLQWQRNDNTMIKMNWWRILNKPQVY